MTKWQKGTTMIYSKIQNAPTFIRWIYTQQGVAVYNTTSGQLFYPASKSVPSAKYETIITKPCDIILTVDKLIDTIFIKFKKSRLTEKYAKKVHKRLLQAGEGSYTITDPKTHLAEIYAPIRKISLLDHITELAPYSPKAYCINNKNLQGVIDPELRENHFYRLIQRDIQVMGQDSFLSVVGQTGIEIQRPKQNFIILD